MKNLKAREKEREERKAAEERIAARSALGRRVEGGSERYPVGTFESDNAPNAEDFREKDENADNGGSTEGGDSTGKKGKAGAWTPNA